jgi:hypothetical protein
MAFSAPNRFYSKDYFPPGNISFIGSLHSYESFGFGYYQGKTVQDVVMEREYGNEDDDRAMSGYYLSWAVRMFNKGYLKSVDGVILKNQ